ncbi:Phage integrase family protein [uncultured Desulfobacterium sp.]|uniref:Phage integrase family protein n=1 Tax=uncultured Desulfobacterium sp. TaxID=201089 RepID=A0A445MT46_9BACT|nr:Phage integrase family protein [uncultured Desulfobacterium sp.]
MACVTEKKYRDKAGKERIRIVIDFYDQHGKRRIKTLPEGTSKKDAKKELRKIEDQVARDTYLPKDRTPAFSEVASDWLEYKKPNIRASTYQQYEGHVKNHLAPYFGNTPIPRINFDAIEKFISHCNKQGVIPPTLRKFLVTLGGIFKYAVRKKYCDFNPIRDIEKPKTKNKKQIEVFKPEEIRALLENAGDTKIRTLFTLAVMSGMRQGEILGLKWTDIDWFNCQVHVRRTFNHKRFYEPKTATSNRSIDLGPSVIASLKEWQLACPPSDLNLVFPNEYGKPIDDSNLRNRYFNPALRRAKLRGIRFHDLRHSYASLLIDQGEHPKYIQSQMGHSSINVTMDTYGHLMNPVNREASKRLDETVFKKSGDFLVTQKEKVPSGTL